MESGARRAGAAGIAGPAAERGASGGAECPGGRAGSAEGRFGRADILAEAGAKSVIKDSKTWRMGTRRRALFFLGVLHGTSRKPMSVERSLRRMTRAVM